MEWNTYGLNCPVTKGDDLPTPGVSPDTGRRATISKRKSFIPWNLTFASPASRLRVGENSPSGVSLRLFHFRQFGNRDTVMQQPLKLPRNDLSKL